MAEAESGVGKVLVERVVYESLLRRSREYQRVLEERAEERDQEAVIQSNIDRLLYWD